MTYEEQVRRQMEAAGGESIDAAFGLYGYGYNSKLRRSMMRVKPGKKLKRPLKQAGGYTVNIIRRTP